VVSHGDQLSWLFTELLQECFRARNSAIVPEFLGLLDEVDREQLLTYLFVEALRTREWWLAEDCLAYGVSLAPHDACEDGPLYLAMYYLRDSPDVIAWLLDRGAEIDRRGWSYANVTPLIYATSYGLSNVAELLLERGADPNASTKVDNDDTALMCAAESGNRRLVELLLAYGAEVGRKNRWGQDAASLARSAGHDEVYHLLMEHKSQEDHPEPSHIVWQRRARGKSDR
jgi:hypothetical protein